jgi:lipopolysaccharide transport system ATP-binding protein
MALRLAFAVQAFVDSDILIIDEALAVGDINFQQKCMRFLDQYQKNGGTLIFVSHDSSAIRALCNKVIYLKRINGITKVDIGPTAEICNLYLQDQIEENNDSSNQKIKQTIIHNAKSEELNSTKTNFKLINECCYEVSSFEGDLYTKSKEAIITNVFITNNSYQNINTFPGDEILNMNICIETFRQINQPSVDFIIKDRLGQHLISESAGPVLLKEGIKFPSNTKLVVTFQFKMPPLGNGAYTIDFILSDGGHYNNETVVWINDAITLRSSGNRNVVGMLGLIDLGIQIEI